MTLEATMVSVLQALCPRVFPDQAPLSTPMPFVTWQHIGGTPLRYLDSSAMNLRAALIQVVVWSNARATSLALSRAIEEALCTNAGLSAEPSGEVYGIPDSDAQLYGQSQDFDIAAPRTA